MVRELERVKQWVTACNQGHANHCLPTPIAERAPHTIPQWVIDCKNGCIVPGKSCSRYLALSYRWGAPGGFVLTGENVSAVQEHHFLDQLPNNALPVVLLEAMDLVGGLGERYLWVDRLCITQDHTVDADSDVHAMDEIYAGAYLTIVAAGIDRLCGCSFHPGQLSSWEERRIAADEPTKQRISRVLHTRHTGNRWPQAAPLAQRESRPALPQTSGTTPRDIIKEHYVKLLASDWARRGWTFQEQILSRRCVVFLDDRLFWDCQCSFWDERTLTPESDSVSGNFTELARSIADSPIPDFPLYLELVCLYNNRDLTYADDGLSAMAGVLRHFSRSYPGGLVSGLPRLFLDASLLWQPVTIATRRVPELPSWSWCGWQCSVDPRSLRPGLEGYKQSGVVWKVRNLVHWSVLSRDCSDSRIIQEPLLLEGCKTVCADDPRTIPSGWAPTETGDNKVVFTHLRDPHRGQYSLPIPVGPVGPEPQENGVQNLWPYISGTTTSAMFTTNALYTPAWEEGLLVSCAVVKASVFDLPDMPAGAANDDICRVVSLVDSSGKYAGAVRLMEDRSIPLGQNIELVAVSTGSAERQGWYCFQDQFEEAVLWSGGHVFRDAAHPKRVNFERRTLAETKVREEDYKGSAGKTLQSLRDFWKARRARQKVLFEAWSSTPEAVFYDDLQKKEAVYEFYNVIWVEKSNGIRLRRGAGRVVKAAWEGNCGKPSKVIIG